MRTDERLNICYLIYTREVIKVFPDPNDSTHKWHSPLTVNGIFKSEDSVFTNHVLNYYFEEINNSIRNGDWKIPEELIQSIVAFQKKYGAQVLPTEFHTKAEVFYNQSNIFARLTNIYLLVGILLLLIQFIHIFLPRFNIMFYSVPATIIVAVTFLLHTLGLALRWYISGHAPWSNGYEALLFIAWATILAGLIFSRKSGITISATAVLAALILQTANLSWMDPQVTNLVPVLKSYWLVVHVAVITASYGFLGLGALLAAINLLLMSFETKKNHERIESQINQISRIIEMTLIAGLYLLTIGTFLGGVWANESWGRYWAWDPKETWALVTVIVYAFVVHMLIVPGLKGRLLFNIMSLISFATVLMTYFGVNYYLSGLHSYAKGDPLAVPTVVYYSVTAVLLLAILAVINQLRLKKAYAITDYEEENHY
jgi:cytochrome c-type biogenesis protein CcsB